MDLKLFKAFNAYHNAGDQISQMVIEYVKDQIEPWVVAEPGATDWGSQGFVEVQADELVIDIQGAGTLIGVQFNEKILPAAVVKEKMIARIADIEARDGRKIGKKEFAQLRDEIQFDLLPQAFIRRKVVPVLFHKEFIYIFTSSAKKCDTVMTLLIRAFGEDEFKPARLISVTKNDVGGVLTATARDGSIDTDLGYFEVRDVAVLKGKDKQTINIKDKDVASTDIQNLLKQDYQVTKLGLGAVDNDAEALCEFVVNDALIFSQLQLPDISFKSENQEGFIGVVWAVSQALDAVTRLMIETLGGLQIDGKEEKPAPPVDDDDDL